MKPLECCQGPPTFAIKGSNMTNYDFVVKHNKARFVKSIGHGLKFQNFENPEIKKFNS